MAVVRGQHRVGELYGPPYPGTQVLAEVGPVVPEMSSDRGVVLEFLEAYCPVLGESGGHFFQPHGQVRVFQERAVVLGMVDGM